MLITTSGIVLASPPYNSKVAEIAGFSEKEEVPLTNLLESLGEFEAAEAAHKAVQLAVEQTSYLEDLGDEILLILDALTEMPFAVVESMSFAALCPRDVHVAIGWSGARLSDLLGLRDLA